jgi:hypothetical protein
MMQTSSLNSVARCVYLLATLAFVCSCSSSSDDGNTGGSDFAPVTGGIATAGSGGGFGGESGTGGIPGTTGDSGINANPGGSGGLATGGTGGSAGIEPFDGGSGTGGTAGINPGADSGINPGADSGINPGADSGTGTPGRSAGCGKSSTVTFEPVPLESAGNEGVGEGGYVRIQSSGQERGFAMRLPDNYDNNQPYWLIFAFHWMGGNSMEVDTGGTSKYEFSYYGLQKLSNNGAIFVAPDGLGAGWANAGGQDLVFVDDMLKLIEDNYCVDTSHIFASGFSFGGGMSYAIACARAKVFRGVAIYEGAIISGCDGGTDPIAYWQLAGLTDERCTIDMAIPMRDTFVRNNGCTTQNPPQPPQPPPYLNPGGHICTDYEGCTSGYPLRWCVHQSGHTPAPIDGDPDLYNGIDSWTPEEVWSWMTSL